MTSPNPGKSWTLENRSFVSNPSSMTSALLFLMASITAIATFFGSEIRANFGAGKPNFKN